jgi:hypothetical protein
MQNRVKNIIITIVFCVILIAVFVINIVSEDKIISESERRKLAQMPNVTVKTVANGDAMEDWNKYVTDQFFERDFFRSIKSFFSINIFRQKDNNKLFEKDGAIYKMEYPISTKNIEKSASKIENVYKKYLNGGDCLDLIFK